MLIMCLALACGVACSRFPDSNQLPISVPIGFRPFSRNPNAKLLLEMWGDPLCPGCAEDWGTMMQVAAHNDTVDFVFHPFPLPYHRNSFFAAMGTYAAEQLKPGSFALWVSTVYHNIDKYEDEATRQLSAEDVISMYAKTAASIGFDEAEFRSKLSDSAINRKVRTQFDQGAVRRISGTPMFRLNGTPVLAVGWNYNNWMTFLKSLLN